MNLFLSLPVHLGQRQVPKNPEWLAEEWRERAACFAVLDTLQRYAKATKGWSILPGSTKDSSLCADVLQHLSVLARISRHNVKDYITKSKKSGYRALHITLCTNAHVSVYQAIWMCHAHGPGYNPNAESIQPRHRPTEGFRQHGLQVGGSGFVFRP